MGQMSNPSLGWNRRDILKIYGNDFDELHAEPFS